MAGHVNFAFSFWYFIKVSIPHLHRLQQFGLDYLIAVLSYLATAWFYWALFSLIENISISSGKPKLGRRAAVFRWVFAGLTLTLSLPRYSYNMLIHVYFPKSFLIYYSMRSLEVGLDIFCLGVSVWALIVAYKLFVRLGELRFVAPQAAVDKQPVWVPEVILSIWAGIKKSREMAAYHGRDPIDASAETWDQSQHS
jgi:hypothetical protein